VRIETPGTTGNTGTVGETGVTEVTEGIETESRQWGRAVGGVGVAVVVVVVGEEAAVEEGLPVVVQTPITLPWMP
jgi:hypothetical protein